MSWEQLTPRVVKLGSEPNFTPRDAGVLDPTANFCFVAIGKSSINVMVAFAEGNLNSLFDLVGAGFPCSKTNCWDLIASIKSESLSITQIFSVERFSRLGGVEVFQRRGDIDGKGIPQGQALISTYLVC